MSMKTDFLYQVRLEFLDKEFAATIIKMFKDLKAKCGPNL